MIPLVFCIATIVVVAVFAYIHFWMFSPRDVLKGLKAGIFRTSSTYDSPAIAVLNSPRMYLELWAARPTGYIIFVTRWPSPRHRVEGTPEWRTAKTEELVLTYDRDGEPLSGGMSAKTLRQIFHYVQPS